MASENFELREIQRHVWAAMRIQVDCLEAKIGAFHTRSSSPVGMLFFHQFLPYCIAILRESIL